MAVAFCSFYSRGATPWLFHLRGAATRRFEPLILHHCRNFQQARGLSTDWSAVVRSGSFLTLCSWRLRKGSFADMSVGGHKRQCRQLAVSSMGTPAAVAGSAVVVGTGAPTSSSSPLYDYSKSTRDNYTSKIPRPLVGEYVHLRETMDHNYHGYYTEERQLLQDQIIKSLGTSVVEGMCPRPKELWIVFTAGGMGAGKSRAMKWLSDNGYFPLSSFVRVDPDIIRYKLPEMSGYLARGMDTAGTLTHHEAGLIAELLTLAALGQGHNVLVDGSLRDADWHSRYIKQLRQKREGLKVAIIHCVASTDKVLARAAARAEITKRVVPMTTLLKTLGQVPQSVEELSPMTDYCVRLDTNGAVPVITTPGETWSSFQARWLPEFSGSVDRSKDPEVPNTNAST